MDLLILLAVLVCPIAMGTMMFLMWRGMRGGRSHDDRMPRSNDEVAGR